MEEQLISFETAKLAKEKGFSWTVKQYYYINRCTGFNGHKLSCIQPIGIPMDFNNDFSDDEFHYSALTQYLLQKWLREVHNIFIYILPDIDGQWGYGIMLKDVNHTQSNRFELDEIIGTYEEALESGLQEALNLIKPKE